MAESARSELLKHVEKIDQDYSLGSLNPLGSGGVADYFTVATTTVELATAVKAAIDINLPYLVIGQGEKVLFSDGGFPGLVIQNKTTSFGVSADKSQIVVDAGLSLSSCIGFAASQGLGGMTYLYGEPGTVGGAIYSNLRKDGRDFSSMVRFLTVLMPPAKLQAEATINRYRREWLETEGVTRLQKLKADSPLDKPQPVILTAVLQLTSLRFDELRNQLHRAVGQPGLEKPKGEVFGPVFQNLPDGTPVAQVLRAMQAHKVRVDNVFPDKRLPNYFRYKGQSVRSEQIRELIRRIQEEALEKMGVTLVSRYEYLGVW